MGKFGGITVFLLVAGWNLAVAQAPSDRFYQAIRNNDLTALDSLIKSSDVNTKDERGSTPLMYAAAFGSLNEMQLLVAAGADVNAKNAFDSTRLLDRLPESALPGGKRRERERAIEARPDGVANCRWIQRWV